MTIIAQVSKVYKPNFIDSLFSSTPHLTIETPSDSVFAKRFIIYRLENGESISLHKNSTVEFATHGYAPNVGKWIFDTEQKMFVFIYSKQGKEYYYLIRYREFLYLIPPKKLIEFINRYKQSIEKHKNSPPFQLEVGGKFYSWEHHVIADLSAENLTSDYWE